MSFTFWFIIWFGGTLLILAPILIAISARPNLTDWEKVGITTLVSLLWPVAMILGCINSWRTLWSGK